MKGVVIALTVVLCLTTGAGASQFQWGGEWCFFLGYAQTESDNVKATYEYQGLFGSRSESTSSNEVFDDSIHIGAGYRYFEYFPSIDLNLGLGVDLSYYTAKSKRAYFNVLPLSLHFWLGKDLLEGHDGDKGMVRLYGGLGLVMAMIDGSMDLQDEMDETISSATASGGGVVLSLGCSYGIGVESELFLELRHYMLEAEVREGGGSLFFSEEDWKVKVDLTTTSLVAGVTF